MWRTNRRKRSPNESDELLEAWNDLQQTVGKVIDFDLDSCLDSSTPKSSRHGLLLWGEDIQNPNLKYAIATVSQLICVSFE